MHVLYFISAAVSLSAFGAALGFAGAALLVYVEIHQ